MRGPDTFDVHVVSHTHWDREWYLPAGRFRQRLVALIDELLDSPTAPRDPFLLDGQAVVLEDYLAVRPERREALAARLRDGTLEAGPWYVLADELIPSGEALVRNLLAGRRTLAALGAAAPPVLYSPDAFGHPATLPKLAAGFGCELIILWRGLGGERWPGGDTFWWRAPDGTRALVHHLPRDGYEYGSNLPADDEAARARWHRLREGLATRARLGVLLVLNGADHHARQEALAESVAALARAAAPDRVARSSLAAFARAVVPRAARTQLPEIEGELRSSYGYTWALQGTFATRAHLKRRNAVVERLLLRDAEPWAALAARAGGAPRRPLVQAAWKALLLCHPHDTLCGCSTDEVARAMEVRLDDAESQARGIRHDALLDLAGHDSVRARTAPERWRSVVLVRNPTARERGGIAELELSAFRQHVAVGPGSGGVAPVGKSSIELALDGGAVPIQVLDRTTRHERTESPRHYPDNDLVDVARVVAWVPPVAGYGIRAFDLGREAAGSAGEQARERLAPPPVRVGEHWMENEHLRVEWDAEGRLRLESPRAGGAGPPLLRFEDVGDAGDLYTPSPVGPTASEARTASPPVVAHAGPLRGELELRYELVVPESAAERRGGRRVVLPVAARVVVDADARFLRVRLEWRNTARDHRLRVVFATGIAGGPVHADGVFGPARREPVTVSRAAAAVEQPPPTAPLHRYVTIAGDASGVTVFGDGLAEYEASLDGEVAVTLSRAVGELSRNDLPERPGHAGWPVPTPEAQSLGAHHAELAIMPHGPRDDATIALIERAADDVLLPLAGSTLRSALVRPAPTHGVTLVGEALAFSACTESEDGEWLVLRCVNLSDGASRGRWRLGVPVREARLARLDETPLSPLPAAGGEVAFDAPARGVVTVLVR